MQHICQKYGYQYLTASVHSFATSVVHVQVSLADVFRREKFQNREPAYVMYFETASGKYTATIHFLGNFNEEVIRGNSCYSLQLV